ncbi:MAG: CRTAC1 family protein, partial [Verrucomicrobiota bacterium]
DNDGWLDVYIGNGSTGFRDIIPNRMFRNDGGAGFQDVTSSGGFGHIQKGHGIAFADLDNDGDQDIYAVMGGAFSSDVYQNVLFHNPGHGNRWITLKLEGGPSNRSAIGARIAVTVETPAGPRTLHRMVSAGGSFGANSLQAEIGLGAAERIEAVEVFWPASKNRQRFEAVEMDTRYRLVEGAEALQPIVANRLDFTRTEPAGGGHHHHH